MGRFSWLAFLFCTIDIEHGINADIIFLFISNDTMLNEREIWKDMTGTSTGQHVVFVGVVI